MRPFRNGKLDTDTLTRLVEFQIAQGSHGVGVTGTTGEPTSLAYDERELVIRTAVEAARARAGAGGH